MPPRLGSSKLVVPSPPKSVPRIENRAVLFEMGSVCPSAGAANRKDGPAKIPIEPRKGPDPLPPPSGGKTPVVSRNSVRESAG
jgi:hypothetical protein